MIYTNIYDTHTHSKYSFDGHFSVEEMCESAIQKGAKGLCITDHCDIDGENEDFFALFASLARDINALKNKLDKNQFELCFGIELGQGIYRKELSKEILSKFDFDFVLGSVHNLENMEDFYFLDYSKYNIDDLLMKYFVAVLETAKLNFADSIAHLTYPLRYIVAREHINVDMKKFDNIIDQILLEIIKNEKALELNVSGLSMDINDTLPNKKYIKRFKELGGKYVTIGSDSHYCDKVCNNVDQGMEILKESGFDYFTVFSNRKPKLIEIR